jgi:hypothetical protein
MTGKNHQPYVIAGLLAGLVIIVLGTAAFAKPRRVQRMPQGAWGAPHIKLNVTAHAADVEFDCAHGKINGPLTLDSRGRFNLSGSYTREHGGPIRMDIKAIDRPVRYSGSITGASMTLKITIVGSNEVIGTFTLTRGGPGRVFKCR